MTMKSCDEYSAERFGYWKEIENHGNLKGCGVHKAVWYYTLDSAFIFLWFLCLGLLFRQRLHSSHENQGCNPTEGKSY